MVPAVELVKMVVLELAAAAVLHRLLRLVQVQEFTLLPAVLVVVEQGVSKMVLLVKILILQTAHLIPVQMVRMLEEVEMVAVQAAAAGDIMAVNKMGYM